MLLSLDYELIEAINYVISNLMEFGLIDRWSKRAEEPNARATITEAKQREGKSKNVVLTVDHIVGALLIMAFGYLLAIVVFVVEQLVYRSIHRGTEFRLFWILHRYFRPNRIGCMVTPFTVNNL